MANNIQNRISFYQNVAHTKDSLMKSEVQRLQLEKEFHKNVNSDKKFIKDKALKLQAYYKKLCDDERNSSLRNQHILAEMSRVDQHFQYLESKLERLTTLKKECEKHLTNNYPGWNEFKINILNNNSNQNQNTWSSIANNQNKPNSNQFTLQSGLQNFGEIQNRIGSYLSSTGINEQQSGDTINNYKSPKQEQMRQNFLLKPDINYLNEQQNQKIASNEQNNNLQGLLIKQNLASPPDNFIADALIKSNPLFNSTSNPSSPIKQSQGRQSTDNIVKEYEREIAMQDGTYNMLNQQNNATIPGIDELFKSATQNKSQPTWQHTQLVRNFEDSDGPTSPLSNNNKSETSEVNEEFSRKRGGSLRQELNLSGLYRLLDVVESDMNHTIHPQKYYRQDQPPYKSRLDIIKWAIKNDSNLDDMDAGNVSMVVLDQLRVVVRKQTKNACLFTREILSFSVADINENIVEKYIIDAKDKDLWKRLLRHFCLLKRFCSMDSAILANLFAPSLIAQDGFGAQKAIQFLEKIINASVNTHEFDKSDGRTETSFYDEMHVSSKLKDTKTYQNFIMSTGSKKPSRFSDDEDEIEKIVAPPKGILSSGLSNVKPTIPTTFPTQNNTVSPRDGEFDFSQSSSDVRGDPGMIVYVNKSLNSTKSSKDKKPIYMRDYDSDLDESDDSNKSPNTYNDGRVDSMNRNKISDASLEFYN